MSDVLKSLVERYPDLNGCAASVRSAFDAMAGCFRSGGKLLVCGNGGSAADSEHIVGELMKGFTSPRPIPDAVRRRLVEGYGPDGTYVADHLQGALPAISLVSQTALGSAIANDTAAEMVFAQQVYGYGRTGDVLLAISVSGKARNVLHALQVARILGLRTIGLSGSTGGAMAPLCDILICAPGAVADVQERHLPIYHALCEMIEQEFFGP